MFYSSKVDSLNQTTKNNIDKMHYFIDKVHFLTFLNGKILQYKNINKVFITYFNFNFYL